jgi:hypothetical protein
LKAGAAAAVLRPSWSDRKNDSTANKDEIDLEKARLDPGSVFADPEALRDYGGLTREQKIELLRRWACDASELAVAEEEGMTGGEPSRRSGILAMLHAMTGGYDVEHSPPTKRKGV